MIYCLSKDPQKLNFTEEKHGPSQSWWHTSLLPAMNKQPDRSVNSPGQPGLYSKILSQKKKKPQTKQTKRKHRDPTQRQIDWHFQGSLDYIVRTLWGTGTTQQTAAARREQSAVLLPTNLFAQAPFLPSVILIHFHVFNSRIHIHLGHASSTKDKQGFHLF